MVSIALLMIGEATPDCMPNALQPISGKAIIHRQILQLRKLGIDRFIVAVDVMNSRILTFAEGLRKDNIEIEFVRTLHVLGDILNHNDEFIMIADALHCDDIDLKTLIDEKAQIWVVENDKSKSAFELIDLNYRWSGLAKLDGSIIDLLEKMPEESAVHSTLLRLALQKSFDIIPVNIVLKIIKGRNDADDITNAEFQNIYEIDRHKGFLERYALKNIIKYLLYFVWEKPETKKVMQFGAIVMAVLTAILAFFGVVTTCYISAFLCSIMLVIQKNYYYFENKIVDFRKLEILTLIILFMAVITLGYDQYLHYYTTIILFLMGYSLSYIHRSYIKYHLSFADIFLILMIMSLWNIQMIASMTLSTLMAVMITINIVLDHKRSVK